MNLVINPTIYYIKKYPSTTKQILNEIKQTNKQIKTVAAEVTCLSTYIFLGGDRVSPAI